MVKDLNLKPNGKESLDQFVAGKSPSNMVSRITVSVYYLTKVLGQNNVSVNHIYTCFRWLKWKLPLQLVNIIHQAGVKGWLGTSDRENVLLTMLGENLVEYELPSIKE